MKGRYIRRPIELKLTPWLLTNWPPWALVQLIIDYQLNQTVYSNFGLKRAVQPLSPWNGRPCRAAALRSGDGKMHRTDYWVGQGAQGQRPVPQRANAAKAGETSAFGDATDHADKRARPLERRDRNTARPPLVFIRLRNPCFLARRRLLG